MEEYPLENFLGPPKSLPREAGLARLDRAAEDEVDIHEGLESTLTLIHNQLKDRVTVHKDYGDVPLVRCHPSRLNQVYMNLLVNASQAIEGKGEIHLKPGFPFWPWHGHSIHRRRPECHVFSR